MQNYTYSNNTYVFCDKKRRVSISDTTMRDILHLYCTKGYSVPDITRKYPTYNTVDLTAILKTLKITHSSLPVTREMLQSSTDSVIIDDLLEKRKNNIQTALEKEEYARIKKNSDTFELIQRQEYNPVIEFLKNYKFTNNHTTLVKKKTTNTSDVLLCSLNDIHLGEYTKSADLFHGEDYNSEKCVEMIKRYADHIVENNPSVQRCELIINGDFLHSCLNGTTVQGTKLTSDKTNESMFEAGLDLLVYFITTLSNNFRTLRVHFIKGNHDGVVLSYLGYAVKQYFRDNPNLDVDICKSWAKLFTIDSMAVLAMHGGSDMYKHANIPRNENAMKTYIHEMFLAKNDTISHCKDRVVVSGHLHNFSHRDMGSFDFYTFGTSVVGDKYADALNFPRAKPRQNCLLIRDSKVIATQHYYF